MFNCSKCNNTGTIEKDGKMYECECAFFKRIAMSMPPFIRNATILPGHLDTKLIDKFSKSCLLVSSWQDAKAIIKALYIKYSSKFIKITSDREIRDVFVGYTSKSSHIEGNSPIYNSLADLVDAPDLIIIRLNELGYKNKAAPGVLEEAMRYRLDRDKPIWAISDIDKPFTVGCYAYSESVGELLGTFLRISVPRIIPKIATEDLFNAESVRTQIKNESQPKISDTPDAPDEKHVRQKPKIRPSPDDDGIPTGLDIYGSGVGKGSRFKR